MYSQGIAVDVSAERLKRFFVEVPGGYKIHNRIRETEISDQDGRWYSLQIRPYRTSDNRIDGVVVLFFDISEINALKTSLI